MSPFRFRDFFGKYLKQQEQRKIPGSSLFTEKQFRLTGAIQLFVDGEQSVNERAGENLSVFNLPKEINFR